MRTFKDLQDSALAWMADSSDAGLMRELVTDAIAYQHQQLLREDRYDFMLWPRTETLSIVSGQTMYPLHARFDQPLFVYDTTTNNYLEEIPAKSLLESGAQWSDAAPSPPDRFMLTTLSKFKRQPASAGPITVTTTGGTEAAVNSFIITGINSSGDEISETLSSSNPWTTLTTTASFEILLDVTKVNSGWSRTVTITDSSGNTLVSLLAAEYGKQYRMLEIIGTPAASSTLTYRFYRKPRTLSADHDIPDLPEGYDDLLVLKALLAMQGYSRATPDEQQLWKDRVKTLEQGLKMTYQQSRSLGGRTTYTRYIPRG